MLWLRVTAERFVVLLVVERLYVVPELLLFLLSWYVPPENVRLPVVYLLVPPLLLPLLPFVD